MHTPAIIIDAPDVCSGVKI